MILGLRDQWNIMALGYNASRELFACASPKTERKRRSQTIPRSSPKRSCGLESETPPPGRPPEVAAGDPARPICSCGQGRAAVAGLCIACYRRWQYSARFFGGNRDSALDRGGRACRGCHARDYLNVHHRRPGDRTQLVTLCAGCHARVHRSRILGAGCRRSWSCFGANGIPMRSSSCSFPSNCRPPNRRERAGKHSRVFLREPPPANSRRTSQTGAANILGFCSPIRRSTASSGPPRTAGTRGRVSDNTLAVAITAGRPDWRSVASLAVDAVSSAHSNRAYQKALKDFVAWHSAEPRPPFSRAVVQQYRSVLEAAGLAPASIHLRLSAIRKLAAEAAENGWLDRSVAPGNRVPQGRPPIRQQGRELVYQGTGAPPARSARHRHHRRKRDRAILAVLLGCALRRSGLATLECRHLQPRDGRWVFVDLVGKGKRIRPVPIPPFVKVAMDAWTAAAGLSEGPLFRRVRRRKYPETTPEAVSERMIWHIVMKCAREAGLVDKLAPHDLSRTAPSSSGGDLEQSVPAGPRLHTNHRAVSGMTAEFQRSGQRSAWGWTLLDRRASILAIKCNSQDLISHAKLSEELFTVMSDGQCDRHLVGGSQHLLLN